MKSIRYILAVLMIASCMLMTASAAGKKVVLEGSTTVLPIAQAAAEEFMDRNPDADIVVRGGGSGVGIASLIEGTCDIADASRAIKNDELQKAAVKGIYPKANVIATDGIAVIVNHSNGMSNLTKQQVRDIFTGKLTNWKQLGLKDAKIIAVSRDSASGTFEAFGELALHNERVRSDALMQASNQAIVAVAGKTPGAIGYIGLGYLNNSVKAVTIDGIQPTRQNVLSGKYPYSRQLYMYTKGAPQGTAKEFIDYIFSPVGKKLVEQEGFVPLR